MENNNNRGFNQSNANGIKEITKKQNVFQKVWNSKLGKWIVIGGATVTVAVVVLKKCNIWPFNKKEESAEEDAE